MFVCLVLWFVFAFVFFLCFLELQKSWPMICLAYFGIDLSSRSSIIEAVPSNHSRQFFPGTEKDPRRLRPTLAGIHFLGVKTLPVLVTHFLRFIIFSPNKNRFRKKFWINSITMGNFIWLHHMTFWLRGLRPCIFMIMAASPWSRNPNSSNTGSKGDGRAGCTVCQIGRTPMISHDPTCPFPLVYRLRQVEVWVLNFWKMSVSEGHLLTEWLREWRH